MSNIHKIKISGVTEIESPLDIKMDYGLTLRRCAIKSVVKKQTNEDENFIYTYNLESLDIATLISEGGTIQGKAKSFAKRLRGAIYHIGNERGVEETEKFYEEAGNKIMAKLEEII